MSLPAEPNLADSESATTDPTSASGNALGYRNASPTKRGRLKVLLVDDSRDDIFLSRKALESNKCDVVSANSVTEAFSQIAAQSFDVLITDLHMPDAGDGFAVVTAMRHSARGVDLSGQQFSGC
jgi:PleD family two-component response regulator